MRTALALLLFAGLAACRTAVGDPCKTDEDCGPGFDCYRDRCARVCTKTEECDKGDTCYRYRCMSPNGAPITVTPKPSAPLDRAPMPDATAAELRAMRRELELIHEGQARILQLLEGRGGLPAPAPAKPQP